MAEYQFDPNDSPGSFRIGPIQLSVPPLAIHINMAKFEDQMMTMRQTGPNIIKTGRAMHTADIDLVFSGSRMINTKLLPILAMIRRSPFVTIANETIGRIFGEDYDHSLEFPVAVAGYALNTEQSLPDTIFMTLSLMIFNCSPITGGWQYLRQGVRMADGLPTPFNEDGNLIIQPAHNAADSNFYCQFYEKLIRPNDIGDFMFQGEVGPNDQSKDYRYSLSSSLTRLDPTGNIIKNGLYIRQVPDHFVGSTAMIGIGYHIQNIVDALDLSIGAYKSVRINQGTGGWVWTDEDLRRDILQALREQNIDPDITETTTTGELIAKYTTELSNVAVRNLSAKYLKRFNITNGGNRTILGISLHRSIPLSVNPIISSPVPTCQYLGGSATDITVTMVVTSDAYLSLLTKVDGKIEEGFRDIMHNAGSDLLYIDNDIANMNGTFVVNNGDMDIQSIPEQPGAYVVKLTYNEQTEHTRMLTSDIYFQSPDFKRQIIEEIFNAKDFAGWRLENSYDPRTGRFKFHDTRPSYTETLVIPSMMRALRNGFLRACREGSEQNPGLDLSNIDNAAAVMGYLSSGEADPALLLYNQGMSKAYTAGKATTGLIGSAAVPDRFILTDSQEHEVLADMKKYNYSYAEALVANGLTSAVTLGSGEAGAPITTAASESSTSLMASRSGLTDLWRCCIGEIGVDPQTRVAHYVGSGTKVSEEPLSIAALQSRLSPEEEYVSGSSAKVTVSKNKVLGKFVQWLQSAVGEEGKATQERASAKEAAKATSATPKTAVQKLGAVKRLEDADLRRLALLLRSPKLLDWERNIYKQASNAHVLPEKPSYDDMLDKHLDFKAPSLAKQFLSCYPDLGIPFEYTCLDQNGKPILQSGTVAMDNQAVRKAMDQTGKVHLAALPKDGHISFTKQNVTLTANTDYALSGQDVQLTSLPTITDVLAIAYHTTGKPVTMIAMTPSFYLSDGYLLQTEDTKTLVNESTQALRQADTALSQSSACEKTFGTACIPSPERCYTMASNGINGASGYVCPSDLATASADLRKSRTAQSTAEFKNIAKNAGPTFRRPRISSLQTTEDLLAQHDFLRNLVNYGQETSNQVIAEAQLEHKAMRSTFTDLNPDIEAAVPHIVQHARADIYGDRKHFSLDKLFPTYRIFFREENAPQWLLFDTYFDYRSVESMRIWREKATPYTVVHLVLNDQNGALRDVRANMATISRAPADRNMAGRLRDIEDKPLQSLFLTPGTQVQIRFGYAANPYDLPGVINGFVSDVSPGERFELIIHSYGIELLNDSDLGFFTGWVCPPKQLISMMLLDSKVKHMGTFISPALLPSSMADFIDGPMFDDNIYINENMEPGDAKLLQVYNGDNMTKWDVLQDIAAAHPGFICQTAPYDERETVFFGRPDDYYKFTQDLGITARYPKIGSITEQIRQEILFNAKQPLLQELISNARDYLPLNTLEWLGIKNQLEDIVNEYHKRLHEEGENQNRSTVYNLLTEYCQCIDMLSQLASNERLCGNIQYDLYGRVAAPLEPTPIIKSMDEVRPAPKLARTSAEERETSVVNTPASQASNNMPPNVVDAGQTKRPIPLQWFITDENARLIVDAGMRDRGNAQAPLQNLIPATDFVRQAQEADEEYQHTGDVEELKKKMTTFGLHYGAVEKPLWNAQKVYEKVGIHSPMAIALWGRIYDIFERLKKLQSQTSSQRHFISISAFGGPTLTIAESNRLEPSGQTDSLTNNMLTFRGRVFHSDLNAHLALRNWLLHRLVNINPNFQELVAIAGHPPTSRRFRRYHVAASHDNIVNNNIKLDYASMWNVVKVKYDRHDFLGVYLPGAVTGLFKGLWSAVGGSPNSEFEIQAGQTLDQRVTRELSVQVDNAKTAGEARAYATSYLAEGIRHMYGGTLTMLGNPDVKPYDVILLADSYNQMYGPIEVASVTHLMSAEHGFITIIEPHALVEPLGVSWSLVSVIGNILDAALMITVVGKGAWFGLKFAGKFAKAATSLGLKNGWKAATADVAVASQKALQSSVAKAKDVADKFTQAMASRRTKQIAIRGQDLKKSITGALDDLEESTRNEVVAATARLTKAGGGNLDKGILAFAKQANPEEAARMEHFASLSSSDIIAALKQAKLPASKLGAIQGRLAAIELKHAAAMAGHYLNVGGGLIGLEKIPSFSSLITSIRLWGIVGTIGYMQLYAGKDDSHYACPLKITPLSYKGGPYMAGLEGLTHQSGLWSYIMGNIYRTIGSFRTLREVLGEKFDNLKSLYEKG